MHQRPPPSAHVPPEWSVRRSPGRSWTARPWPVGHLGGRRLLPTLVLPDDHGPVGVEQGVGDPGAVLAGAEGLVGAVQPVGGARGRDGQAQVPLVVTVSSTKPGAAAQSRSVLVASIGAGLVRRTALRRHRCTVLGGRGWADRSPSPRAQPATARTATARTAATRRVSTLRSIQLPASPVWRFEGEDARVGLRAGRAVGGSGCGRVELWAGRAGGLRWVPRAPTRRFGRGAPSARGAGEPPGRRYPFSIARRRKR